MRSIPTWLVAEPCTDVDLGVIKTGKEAHVGLVERRSDAGAVCQFARKRYLPREVKVKGQLQALGVQRASTFVNDVQYREGRQFRKSRDRRAVERMSSHGRRLLQDRWTGHEHKVMSQLWQAGLSVPYPIGHSDDVFDLEYIGDDTRAAPQLHAVRLSRRELDDVFTQLMDGMRIVIGAGFAHGDLSAYNLLWWDEQLWFIDFPQAVDIAANLAGLEFVRRDVTNVCGWFQRQGLDVDVDDIFDDLLHFM